MEKMSTSKNLGVSVQLTTAEQYLTKLMRLNKKINLQGDKRHSFVNFIEEMGKFLERTKNPFSSKRKFVGEFTGLVRNIETILVGGGIVIEEKVEGKEEVKIQFTLVDRVFIISYRTDISWPQLIIVDGGKIFFLTPQIILEGNKRPFFERSFSLYKNVI